MRHLICLLPLICGAAQANSAQANSTQANSAQEIAAIQKVMSDFHEAVVSHNGARLSDLFIPEGSTWLNVTRSADAAQVHVGSYHDFVRFVSSSRSALNPKHSHVRVLTDGTIASVYFDFVFLIDGREENKGSETWQLVKGADGWRIAALTYSSTPRL